MASFFRLNKPNLDQASSGRMYKTKRRQVADESAYTPHIVRI